MITVYTKNDCVQCTMTKRMMNDLGITFSEVNVEKNETAASMLRLHGYQGLPVVAVEGFNDSWYGFKPDRIEKLTSQERGN